MRARAGRTVKHPATGEEMPGTPATVGTLRARRRLSTTARAAGPAELGRARLVARPATRRTSTTSTCRPGKARADPARGARAGDTRDDVGLGGAIGASGLPLAARFPPTPSTWPGRSSGSSPAPDPLRLDVDVGAVRAGRVYDAVNAKREAIRYIGRERCATTVIPELIPEYEAMVAEQLRPVQAVALHRGARRASWATTLWTTATSRRSTHQKLRFAGAVDPDVARIEAELKATRKVVKDAEAAAAKRASPAAQAPAACPLVGARGRSPQGRRRHERAAQPQPPGRQQGGQPRSCR